MLFLSRGIIGPAGETSRDERQQQQKDFLKIKTQLPVIPTVMALTLSR